MWMILMLLGSLAQADDWYCKHSGTERIDNEIKACGIARMPTEREARHESLLASRLEFQVLCDDSEDCKDHPVSITPKRLECEKTEEGYECTRLMIFTILPRIEKGEEAPYPEDPTLSFFKLQQAHGSE